MASDYDWDVILNVATRGVDKTENELRNIQGLVDDLNRHDAIDPTSAENYTKTLYRQEQTVRKTADAHADLNQKYVDAEKNLAAQRYAQYDIAAAYGAVAASLTALGVVTVKTYADMESGFANVERVLGADVSESQFQQIEKDILSLSREIPVLTSQLQGFAMRGAQMGVPEEKLAQFAETMAKFSATSPEVPINDLAESFGRLSNLTGVRDFEALASSVAQVGIISASTDKEILRTAQELGRAAGSAGFMADEIIGLSSAFASLGAKPEAVRGIMNQFIAAMDKGAAGLSDSMQAAAHYIGLTEQEASKLWKSNPTQFFQRLVAGLSNTEDITAALSEMGTEGARLSPLFKALTEDYKNNAAGQSVLAQNLAAANQGFREKTELERQYAPIAETLNSKFTLLGNSLRELAYSVGLEAGPALAGFIETLTDAINGISDFVQSPFGSWATRVVASLGVVVAAYATLRTVIALASAAQLAFQQISVLTGRTGLLGSLQGFITGFKGVKTSADGASGGVSRLRNSFILLGRATIVIAVIQALVSAISDIPGTAINAGKALQWLYSLGLKVSNWLANTFNNPKLLQAAAWAGGPIKDLGNQLIAWGKANKKASGEASNLGGIVGDLSADLADLEGAGTGAGEALGGPLSEGAGSAAQQVRTLLDYASDLSSVMGRAFEIRFSGESSADEITKSFQALQKAAEESAKRTRDLRQEINSLLADIGVLQQDISRQKYFLSIALEYGDTARAEALTASIAKLQEDLASKQTTLADKQKELSSEQSRATKTLEGNSEAAVENRNAIRNLVQQYQAQIDALAKSGASQATLRAEAERLRADFIRQATQLGYNRDELRKYEAAFDDVVFAIDNVPRDVTIDVNANPALTALQELQAQAEKTAEALSGAGGGGGFGGGGGIPLDDPWTFPEDTMSESGAESGKSWFKSFWDSIVNSDLVSKFTSWLTDLHVSLVLWGVETGSKVWNAFTVGIPTSLAKGAVELGNWFTNLPTTLGATLGSASDALWTAITKTLPDKLSTALNTLRMWLAMAPSNLVSVTAEAGKSLWNTFTGTIPSALADALNLFRTWVTLLPARLVNFASAAGSSIWGVVTEVTGPLSRAYSNMVSWFANLPWNLWSIVSRAGSSLWDWFIDGFKTGASGTRLGRLLSAAGFAEGGYTGAGGKYEPAGVVHRGEYVIPKHDVNQATGLPYADALGRLASRSRGYANGGFVGAAPTQTGTQMVTLSPGSIQALAQATGKNIYLDGKLVAESSAGVYAQQNTVGAY